MKAKATSFLVLVLLLDQNIPPTKRLEFFPCHVNWDIIYRVDTSGYVIHWHYVTGQKLSYIHEKENQLLSVAYDKEGMQFATGGSDYTVRVYNAMNNQLKARLKYGFVSLFH
jgi:hypothetical protein